ncbi:MAG: iron ABC transporter permease [Firmicutes bacterium]|nr:iron ABC transporter permease [Bacillota bacterium]
MRTWRMRQLLIALVLFLLFFALVGLNIKMGSVKMPLGQALIPNTIEHDILWKVRLPRLTAATVLGGALALSGFLLQTFFGNPIAGPFVLGISAGAKLIVALVMVFVLGRGFTVNSKMIVSAAFVGAMLSMAFVLAVARRVNRTSSLIISGVMIGYICSAITDFVVVFASDENIVNLHHWSQGSFSGTSWADVRVMAAVIFVAAVTTFFLSKPISAYRLGESYAQSVGVNIRVFRILLILLSSILCACVTAFAGPVSFVGVAVPHLIKAITRTSKPHIVIPFCFLGGAVFCLGCDLVARTIYAPMEMSISSVSSLLGAPVVIWIMAGRVGGE